MKNRLIISAIHLKSYLVPDRENFISRYEAILSITQFIASMTDSYAVDLFRKIKGVTL
ncbi:MAG: hypothetical protein HQ562_05465 [Candidatus Marinimicrobia bacterium]|nr:hypothetical protein [Candidatus Neomarinimicrobiota bacterium]